MLNEEPEPVALTQLPMETPDNYLDGNPDYWDARSFALSHGYRRRDVGELTNNVLALIKDEPLVPWVDRTDKTQLPGAIISYVLKTQEHGFVIVSDGQMH